MDLIKGNVYKRYNQKQVFSNIPVLIEKGEIYLVIGRNGIGKSTLLRLFARADNSFSGTHLVHKKDISYMLSNLVCYKNMKVSDLLSFYKDTHIKFSIDYAKHYLDDFNIDLKRKINKLSDGERKILAFVVCLSFDCSLYVIDEPFPNVDLLNDEIFRKMIIERYDEDTTFIIATHQINVFEKISSKCILIKNAWTIDSFNSDDIRNETSLSIEDYFKEIIKC